MIGLAARTFYDRWQLFVGGLIAVAVGVGLMQSGLSVITAAGAARVPENSSAADRAQFEAALSGINTLTGMSVCIAIFLTVFVVHSTWGFMVAERRRDLALLRVVGIRRRGVRGLLMAEAIILAVLATGLGVPIGLLLTQAQKALLRQVGGLRVELDTGIGWQFFLWDLLAALTVSVTGAWFSARRASKVRPLEAMRTGEEAGRVMTWQRWAMGLICLAMTAAAAATATSSDMLGALLLGLGIVVFGSVAFSQLSPLLVPVFAAALGVVGANRNVVFSVAISNLREGTRRSASIAAPLIVLVGLAIGLQSILDTQSAAERTERVATTSADLVVRGEGSEVPKIAQVPGVRSMSPESQVTVPVTLVGGGRSVQAGSDAVAVDPATYPGTHPHIPVSGDPARLSRTSIVLGPGLERDTFGTGWTGARVSVGGSVHALSVAAQYDETLAGTDVFLLSRALIPESMLRSAATTTFVQVADGADVASVASRLTTAGVGQVSSVSDWAAQGAEAKDDENKGIMGAVVGLGALYALISLLSTIAIAVSQRQRELAVARISGMTRRQVVVLGVIESTLAALIGFALGAVVVVLCLAGLWRSTAAMYGDAVIALPWEMTGGTLVVSLALSTLVAAIAGVRATRVAPVRFAGAAG